MLSRLEATSLAQRPRPGLLRATLCTPNLQVSAAPSSLRPDTWANFKTVISHTSTFSLFLIACVCVFVCVHTHECAEDVRCPRLSPSTFFHRDRVSQQWEAHHCGKVAGQKMPRIFLALPPSPGLGLQACIIIYSCTAFFGDAGD